MKLHFPTLGLVLVLIGILSSVVMITIRTMYRQERGPGCWAGAAVIATLGFIPVWFEPQIGNLAIILSNLATITTLNLILEGVIRFRNLEISTKIRATGEILAVVLYMFLSFVFIEHARLRYLTGDPILITVLVTTILVMVRGQEHEDFAVFSIVAATFALIVIAFAFRWTLALGDEQGDYNTRMTSIISLTLVPWAIGWNYGFILAINNKSRKALREAARRDPLTGLYNRQWMGEFFENDRARDSETLCLVLLDINGFKRINDRYGHLFGDAVLSHVARMLREELEPKEAAIRYGGDEFVLLLRCEGNDLLNDRLKKITERVGEVVDIEQTPIEISLSYGSSRYPADGVSMDDLFRVADRRMYVNKQQTAT